MLSRFLCSPLLALLLGTPAAVLAAPPSLWFEAERPSEQARYAVQRLVGAAADGLNPAHYHATDLSHAVAQASADPGLAPTRQQQLDTALTQAMQHYLSDLSQGRVRPQQIESRFAPSASEALEIATELQNAVRAQRLPALVEQLATPQPMASELRQALSQYRALAEHPAWQTPLPALPGRKLEAGQHYSGLPQLAQRLQALGDLPPTTPLTPAFEGPLVSALVQFQTRHGLTPDGVIGPLTLRELNTTPAHRAEQIALTMERLRWTPLHQAPRMVVVNVPEFVLRAYEVHDSKIDIKLTMKVIVGKALDTRTPLFDEAMRYIEFSPYWNVPYSIASKETLPRLRRDPAYFEQQGFEFVAPGGRVVTTLSDEHMDAVLTGGWRLRQRPGPKNALGDIKFIFPNNDNIYLHHTPSPGLFERDRRDFSHGCVRVQEPVALAQFVLQDDPSWTQARIQEAMEKGESRTIRLKNPLTVLIAYSTVIVKDGRVFFYPDIYGHDRLLAQTLQRHAKALSLPAMPKSPTP